jgi:hypothetical protein
MWPFSKNKKLHGITRKGADAFTFQITEDEQYEIDKLFDSLKDYRAHPDYADKLTSGLTARGLANYTSDQMMMADLVAKEGDRRDDCIKKAIASITKAYSIHSLPIYLYDLARCLDIMPNGQIEANNTFKLFLTRQSEYRPEPLDDIFLSGRDVNEAQEEVARRVGKAS